MNPVAGFSIAGLVVAPGNIRRGWIGRVVHRDRCGMTDDPRPMTRDELESVVALLRRVVPKVLGLPHRNVACVLVVASEIGGNTAVNVQSFGLGDDDAVMALLVASLARVAGGMSEEFTIRDEPSD